MSPVAFYSPPFVTETDQPAPWQDCTWASGLMLANKVSGGQYPATRAERQALRAASGDHFGGSTLADLSRAIEARYHWHLAYSNLAWLGLLAALLRGDGAAVQGLYSRLPAHFQRWDPHFASTGSASGHCAYVQGHDRGGNQHLDAAGQLADVFWCDPLGRSKPGTSAKDRYRGEWMPVGALHAFVNGLATDAQVYAAAARQGQAA